MNGTRRVRHNQRQDHSEDRRRGGRRVAQKPCPPWYGRESPIDWIKVQNDLQNRISSQEAPRKGEAEMLNRIDALVDPSIGPNLIIREFILIKFTLYCITDEREFIPAEVALASFSLQKGVTDNYSALIDPRTYPPIYEEDVMDNAEDLWLPIPPYSHPRESQHYFTIWKNIRKFIKLHPNLGTPTRHVFCSWPDQPAIQGSFEWFEENTGIPNDPGMVFCPLSLLLHKISEVGIRLNGLPPAMTPPTSSIGSHRGSPVPTQDSGHPASEFSLEAHSPLDFDDPLFGPKTNPLLYEEKAEEFLIRALDHYPLERELSCAHHLVNNNGSKTCPLSLLNLMIYKSLAVLTKIFRIKKIIGTHTPFINPQSEAKRRRLFLSPWGQTGYKPFPLTNFTDSSYEVGPKPGSGGHH